MRPVEVRWCLFSLEEVNKAEGATVDWEGGRTAPVLRTLALVRRKHGQEGVDRLYDTLSQARFVREEVFANEGVVEAALEAAGMDRGLKAAALADPSTIDEVMQEHRTLVEKNEGFGVPTLVLDDGKGAGMFGPVISKVPQGEAAGVLWDHTKWFTQQPEFFELKRVRPAPRH